RHPRHGPDGAAVAGIGTAGQVQPVERRGKIVRRAHARIQTRPGFSGEASLPGRNGRHPGSFMKKVLIIEDDQVIANIYRNKFTVEGYQAEVAYDGESGLKTLRTFKPDIMLLDLVLPRMSGVDFIIKVRSEADFAKLPIIVFSNTYLTNMIQEAWKAGANKCLSKTNCTPRDVLEVVRQTIGGGRALPEPAAKPAGPTASPRPNFTDA